MAGVRPAAKRPAAPPTGWLQPLYELSLNKFYLDELYYAVLVAPLRWLSHAAVWFDNNVIDRTVDLVGAMPRWISAAPRYLQEGVVPSYALMMWAGLLLCLLAVIGLWRGEVEFESANLVDARLIVLAVALVLIPVAAACLLLVFGGAARPGVPRWVALGEHGGDADRGRRCWPTRTTSDVALADGAEARRSAPPRRRSTRPCEYRPAVADVRRDDVSGIDRRR